MIFVPKYTVSYKGILRATGKPFEIDEKDEEEMSKHGDVVADKAVGEEKSDAIKTEKHKKLGRPKKAETKEVSQNGYTESPEKKN